MANWWDSAPLVEQPSAPVQPATEGGNWWEAAPLVAQPKAQQPATPAEPQKTYSGSLLPFSRDAQGNVSFDSDAGFLGAIKRAVMLPGDVASGKVALRDEDGNISKDVTVRSLEAATVVSPVTAGRIMAPRPSVPPPQPNPVIGAAERIGVEIPRAAASNNMSVQRIGQAVANVPIVGNAIKQSSERAISQIGKAAERTADDYAAAGAPTAQEAGATVRQGIENYIGPITTARSKKAYDAVDQFVRPDAKAPLSATAARVAQITAEREAAGLGPSAATQIVQDAIGRGEGLTYQGVKKLRESVGEKLKGGPLQGDISQKELDAIYASLSDDLRSVVTSAGGEKGLAAFERANKYHRLVSERRENLARILKAPSEEGVLEKILASASSSARSDLSLLSQARKALPKDEWDEVAAAAVSRLGQSKRTGEFSADQFVSDFAKLSPQGKSLLFRSTGRGDLAKSLDDIATVSGRFKELQKFANPSGTGQTLLGGSAIAALVAEPATAISTLLGATVASKVLSTPATAKSMAQWSRAYEVAVRSPARGAVEAFKASSRRLAQVIGNELALQPYVAQIARALESATEQGANEVAPEPRPADRQ